MEKEIYQKPVLEVIDFSVRDVITTSGTDVGVDLDTGWKPGGDYDVGM